MKPADLHLALSVLLYSLVINVANEYFYVIFLVNCMHHEIKNIVVTIIFRISFPFQDSIIL